MSRSFTKTQAYNMLIAIENKASRMAFGRLGKSKSARAGTVLSATDWIAIKKIVDKGFKRLKDQ